MLYSNICDDILHCNMLWKICINIAQQIENKQSNIGSIFTVVFPSTSIIDTPKNVTTTLH